MPVDLTDAAATRRALDAIDPDAILHLAAIASNDVVRRDPQRAWAINVEATALLADWCRGRDRRLVFTSTDVVFDGAKAWLNEAEPPRPVTSYSRSKAAAEPYVLATPRGLVARIALQFGPGRHGVESFFDRTLAAVRRGESQTFFVDEYRTPLDYATTADILVRLLGTEATGIVHVGGQERVSRFELARRVVLALGLDPQWIRGNRLADVCFDEPRPADVSLDTTKLANLLPDLRRPTIEDAAASWPAAS